jgi:hypothetical protein
MGTAVASLIYGPLHGALVGFLSNFICDYFLGLQYYALFSIVQAVSAGAWGITPRLLKGSLGTDFFNDGAKTSDTGTRKYEYPHLFFGLMWVSFLSNILATLTVSCVIAAHERHLACNSILMSGGVVLNKPNSMLCDATKLLFSEPSYDFKSAFLELSATKILLGWPDHLIALSVAVLLVAYLLPTRRYKMAGMFGLTLVTQRRETAIYFLVAFMLITLLSIGYSSFTSGEEGLFWDILSVTVYTNIMLVLVSSSRYSFDTFNDDYMKHLFLDVNPTLERAYEDSLKLITVISVINFWFIKSSCVGSNCTMLGSLSNVNGGDKITGFLGLVFIITFIRYLSLIIVRSGRMIRSELLESRFIIFLIGR